MLGDLSKTPNPCWKSARVKPIIIHPLTPCGVELATCQQEKHAGAWSEAEMCRKKSKKMN